MFQIKKDPKLTWYDKKQQQFHEKKRKQTSILVSLYYIKRFSCNVLKKIYLLKKN